MITPIVESLGDIESRAITIVATAARAASPTGKMRGQSRAMSMAAMP